MTDELPDRASGPDVPETAEDASAAHRRPGERPEDGGSIGERFSWLFRAEGGSDGQDVHSHAGTTPLGQDTAHGPSGFLAERAQETAVRPAAVAVGPGSPAARPAAGPPAPRTDDEPRRRGVGLVVALAVVLVLVLAAGALVMVRMTGGDRIAAVPDTSATPAGPSAGTTTASPAAPSSGSDAVAPVRATSVRADCQAPAAVDDAGRTVRYDPALADDGDYSTAWRCDGDAVGTRLTLTLPAGTVVSELGLVNGYAKTDPASDKDRYPEYRRILRVTWMLDGGRTVPQTLRDGVERPQLVRVPATASSQVVLRIDATTDPGSATPTRDAALISEITISRPQ